MQIFKITRATPFAFILDACVCGRLSTGLMLLFYDVVMFQIKTKIRVGNLHFYIRSSSTEFSQRNLHLSINSYVVHPDRISYEP